MKNFWLFLRARQQTNHNQFLTALSEIIYLALVFAVPLYFSFIAPTYNIFELSKLFIFKILVLILLGLTLFNFLAVYFQSGKQVVLRWPRLLIIPFIFIAGLGLSLLFSGNFTLSFFGSYDRQAGLVSYLYYFIFFVLLVGNLLSPLLFKELAPGELMHQKIKRLIQTMVLSGLGVALYGILQSLGIDFLTWPEDPLFTGRAFSSLGQVNFLASWLLLVIPLSFYLVVSSKHNLAKFFYSLSGLLQIIALFLSASRGGLVAFCLVIVIGVIYFLVSIKISRLKKIITASVIFGLLVVSVFLFASFSPERLKSLGDFASGSLAARVDFYGAAVEAWQQKPLFGYGLENGTAVFLAAYQPDWGIHSNVGVQNDKAHNLLLDIALSGGLFLVLVFVLFYYYVLKVFLLNLKSAELNNKRNYFYLTLALGAGILAYLLSLLFSFSFASGEIYFFAYVAILTSLYLETYLKNKHAEILTIFQKSDERKRLGAAHFGLFIWLSALIILMMSYEYKVFRADNYFFAAYHKLITKQYLPALDLLSQTEKASFNPINTEYYRRLAGEILSEDYWQANQAALNLNWQMAVENKLKELDAQAYSPEFTNLLVAGKIKAALGQSAEARELWLEAAALAPYWPRTYLEIARSFRTSDLLSDALAYNHLSLQILPLPEDKRLNEDHKKVVELYRQAIFEEFGAIYFSLGAYEEAAKYYQKAYAANLEKVSLLKNIADTYYFRQDFHNALKFILHGSVRQPQEYSWFLAATILFQEQGENERASEYLQRAQELLPAGRELPRLTQ